MPVTRLASYSVITLVIASAPQAVSAHFTNAPKPETILRFWNLEPWVVSGLLTCCALYSLGVGRLRAARRREPRAGPALRFGCAMLMLFIALISPLGPAGAALGSAHMLQHTLLFFAGPLLVLSYPIGTMLWALPRSWRRQLKHYGKLAAPTWRILSSAIAAWSFHALVLWAWHSPALYTSALDNKWLHDLMHFSFLLSGILLWWAIFKRIGAGLLLLFSTMLHGGILAALMTFSGRVWYPHYSETTAAWGLTALEDQQLAGMVMWVVGGLGYLLAGLGMIALWLQRLESRGRSRLEAATSLRYSRDN